MDVRSGWMILESGTGLMDGVYSHRRDAEDAMSRIHAMRKENTHYLLELKGCLGVSKEVIPDHLFWASNSYAEG